MISAGDDPAIKIYSFSSGKIVRRNNNVQETEKTLCEHCLCLRYAVFHCGRSVQPR